MKQVSVQLEYKDRVFISDPEDATPNQISNDEYLLSVVAKGEATYLSFRCGNIKYHFPEKVLQESILGLVYHDSEQQQP